VSLRAVSVVGWSGSGKTTLIERLVPALAARGLRVAALKHSGHNHPVQRAPGKDSTRFSELGVGVHGFAHGAGLELGLPGGDLPLALRLLDLWGGVDLVVVEGWKEGPLPKVVVHRQGLGAPLWPGRADVVAVVTSDLAPGAPALFRPDEPERLAAFLLLTLHQ
jgi:molybdopterin-guanine dinucleotide biosynthesis protein MobB